MGFSLFGKKKEETTTPRLVVSNEFITKEERTTEINHVVKTFYLERKTGDWRICPWCEGENYKQDTTCCICGKIMQLN